MSKSGWIACAGDNHVTIYDLFDRKVVRTLTTTLASAYSVAISPNGDSVAIHGGGHGGAMAWHSEDGWRTATQTLDFDGVVDGVLCFAEKDGQSCLIWDDRSSSVHELQMQSRTQRVLLEQSGGRLKVASVSDDGQRLEIGGVNGVKAIDLATGQSTFQMKGLSAVHGLAFLPEGRILLTGHESGRIRAWHLPTGQSLGVLFEPRTELGVPSHLMVFPGRHRLLVNYHRNADVTPLLLGTSKLAD